MPLLNNLFNATLHKQPHDSINIFSDNRAITVKKMTSVDELLPQMIKDSIVSQAPPLI